MHSSSAARSHLFANLLLENALEEPRILEEPSHRGLACDNCLHDAVKVGVCLKGPFSEPTGGVRLVSEDHAQVRQLLAVAAARARVQQSGGQLLVCSPVCCKHFNAVSDVLLHRQVAFPPGLSSVEPWMEHTPRAKSLDSFVHCCSNVVGTAAGVTEQRHAAVLDIELVIGRGVLHQQAAIALVRGDAHAFGALQKVEFPVTGGLKQAPLQRPKPAAPTLLPQAQLLPRISEILNQGGLAQQVILVVVAVRHGLVLQIREDRLLVSCCFGVAPEVAQPQAPPCQSEGHIGVLAQVALCCGVFRSPCAGLAAHAPGRVWSAEGLGVKP